MRRHRRERQVVVFGLLIILIAALSVGAAAVYRGDAVGPFETEFVSPAGDFESDITLVCPPASTPPMDPAEVVVRVLNGTDTNGLAGAVESELSDRGYLTVGAANWSRGNLDGTVRILFGSDGIAEAYTLARNFTEVELMLDNREGPTVDVVVGGDYDAAVSLRSTFDDLLDPDLNLFTDDECLPWTQIDAVPAPAVLPENPLAPEPSASPSADAEE